MKNLAAKMYVNAKPKLFRRTAVVSLVIGAVLPRLVRSQTISFDRITPVDADEGFEAVGNLFDNLVDFGLGLLIILAVVLVLYSAYLHLFAGGEAEKIKEARRYILYTAYAIAIGLLAKGIIFIFAELASDQQVDVSDNL